MPNWIFQIISLGGLLADPDGKTLSSKRIFALGLAIVAVVGFFIGKDAASVGTLLAPAVLVFITQAVTKT